MSFKLTEREIAIAQGLDPDAKPEPTEDAKPVAAKSSAKTKETDESEESEETSDDAESEKQVAGKSKDAAQVQKSEKGKEARPAATSWINADVKAQAKELGLDEAEIGEFESLAEFNRAAKHLAKHKAEKKATPDDEDIELNEKDFADYDENTLKLVKLAKKLKDEVKRLSGETKASAEARQVEKHQQLIEQFHTTLDGMSEELYGRSQDEDGDEAELSEELDGNRRKVFEKFVKLYNAEVDAAEKEKRRPKLGLKKLLKEAETLALSKEIKELEKQKRNDELKDQAKKRRPVSSSVPRQHEAPAKGAKEKKIDPSEIANSPDLVKMFDKFQEENGKK